MRELGEIKYPKSDLLTSVITQHLITILKVILGAINFPLTPRALIRDLNNFVKTVISVSIGVSIIK